jgi:hypothetical protein
VEEREQEQQQRLAAQVTVGQRGPGRQRAAGVGPVPGSEPAADLGGVELLQARDGGAVGVADLAGDRCPAGQQDRCRAAQPGFPLLEGLDPLEVVGVADAAGLQELVEAVQEDHRLRVPGALSEFRPAYDAPCQVLDGSLDLLLDPGV